MSFTRREALMTAAGMAVGCGCGLFLGGRGRGRYEPGPAFSVLDRIGHAPAAKDALQKLIDGNARFVAGRPTHPHNDKAWRDALVSVQHPYAVILGCSDSRVSPEVLFDEGLGELFVVRQAGHVADDDSLGSVEYAVGHLHVPLVVVLGHQNCGAVTAAVGSILRDEPVEGHILRLVDDIAPAVQESLAANGDDVEVVIRANVRHVVRRLRGSGPVLRPKVRSGNVRIVGGYYSLKTGLVEWLAD